MTNKHYTYLNLLLKVRGLGVHMFTFTSEV